MRPDVFSVPNPLPSTAAIYFDQYRPSRCRPFRAPHPWIARRVSVNHENSDDTSSFARLLAAAPRRFSRLGRRRACVSVGVGWRFVVFCCDRCVNCVVPPPVRHSEAGVEAVRLSVHMQCLSFISSGRKRPSLRVQFWLFSTTSVDGGIVYSDCECEFICL